MSRIFLRRRFRLAKISAVQIIKAQPIHNRVCGLDVLCFYEQVNVVAFSGHRVAVYKIRNGNAFIDDVLYSGGFEGFCNFPAPFQAFGCGGEIPGLLQA